MSQNLRDPEANKRFSILLFGILFLWPILQLAQFKPWALFDPNNLEVIGNFLEKFPPPNFSIEFLKLIVTATIETIAMATARVVLASFIGIPFGLMMTYSLSISRMGPANGHQLTKLFRYIARFFMVILRSIPEIVWALLLVRILGLGASAGVMAIAITYGGMLAKVYAEILESSNTLPAKALMISGSSRVNAFLYGLLPSSAQELASYTVYRWEAAIRTSVIMGFVGAGGLGQLMDQSMKLLNGSEVATILIVFLLLVLIADYISWQIRKMLA